MLQERRNDIGLKIVYVFLTAIITLLLSLFFNKTYNLAEEARYQGTENSKDIAVLQTNYKEIDRRLALIDTKIDRLFAAIK